MHVAAAILLFGLTDYSCQVLANSRQQPSCALTEPRSDCGYYGITAQECTGKGCCWGPATAKFGRSQASSKAGTQSTSALSDVPWCFYPNGPSQDGYIVKSVQETDLGYIMLLEAPAGKASRTQQESSPFGASYASLQVDVWHETSSRLHVRIAPADTKVWEVPQWLLPRPPLPEARPADLATVFVPPPVGQPFQFAVQRAGPGGSTLFNTSGHTLVYKPQYMELATSLPATSSVYGLGDTVQPEGWRLVRDGRAVTLWAADAFSGTPGHNVYSAHPFLMEVRDDGSSHGVMLMNSNAMDVLLQPETISYRVTGGILDLYFLAGPDPEAVAEQYHAIIGRPAMPPRWALGFHQCRWGYKDVDELMSVVDGYQQASIPLEVLWTDIDYMVSHMDFTFDPAHFPVGAMRSLVDRLHAARQRWVPIIDPGIPLVAGYHAYERALAEGLFIRDRTGAPLLGEVWPGPTHWPDFLHPNISSYWADLIRGMWQQVPFDGLWIDMNEASNFCPGEVCWLPSALATSAAAARGSPAHQPADEPGIVAAQGGAGQQGQTGDEGPTSGLAGLTAQYAPRLPWSAKAAWVVEGAGSGLDAAGWRTPNCMIQCKDPEPGDVISHPPYAINNQNGHLPLGWKTLAMSAVHHGGVLEYDAHNLYGLAEAKVTYDVLQQLLGTRPFVLTRSTFPGSGKYAARWTGDNGANWDNLRWSVPGLFNSWAWGVPLTGSDICGFNGDTREELCARWLSAGAFYPFARDHSDLNSQHQEAYRWPAAAQAARTALALRYSLLPHLYTTLYLAHRTGGGVARPMLTRWPGMAEARGGKAADQQWLLGDGVLVAPVLEEGQAAVRGAWVPPGAWYSAWDYSHVLTGPADVDIPALLGHVPVFYGEGSVLPLHSPRMTTHEVVRTPLTLVVAMRRASCSARPAQPAPDKVRRACPADAGSSTGAPDTAGEGSTQQCALDWRHVGPGAAASKTARYLAQHGARQQRAAAPSTKRHSLLSAWQRWLEAQAQEQPLGAASAAAAHGAAAEVQARSVRRLTVSNHHASPAAANIRSERASSASMADRTSSGKGYCYSEEVEVAAGVLYADNGGTLEPGKPGATLEAHMTVTVVPALSPPRGTHAAGPHSAAGGAGAAVLKDAAGWCGGTCAGVLTYLIANAPPQHAQQQQRAGAGAASSNTANTASGINDDDDSDQAALLRLVVGKAVVMPVDPLPSSSYAAMLNGRLLPASALAYNATARTLTIDLSQQPAGSGGGAAAAGTRGGGEDRIGDVGGSLGISAWQEFELEWGPAFVLGQSS
eukprot:CAMPEP_0202870766 /NCGR_PEP_ID=MMETSP1391-20130828/16729_1 /ASSEMBLY_ACC=CAM_ASM_000867 /TAXON_ID=1034604 /ORGANISM="Chlamydomonas leiostraca, Strain SAG 11-49" /LENGTH=1290 /DNA_ID=CAMNT_0049551399 /DNA_START=24 /DNA_END=3896 /DNA_ORIENTATION=-